MYELAMSNLDSNSSFPKRGDTQSGDIRSTYAITPSELLNHYLNTFSSTTSPRGCICKIVDTDGSYKSGQPLSHGPTEVRTKQKGGSSTID